MNGIDLSDLQIGEQLTIYRASAFTRGPFAAGYIGDATVLEVQRRSAILSMPKENHLRQGQPIIRVYRLRFKDSRILRTPSGEPTMMYVHARGGRPTTTVYLTDDEYALVKALLNEEASTPQSSRTERLARRALERIGYHEDLIRSGG